MKTNDTLTDEETFKCLLRICAQIAREPNNCKTHRNHLMFLLMLDAGFRVGEVSKTRKGSLLFDGEHCNSVTVTTEASKTGVARRIPTTERLRLSIMHMHNLVWDPRSVYDHNFAFFSQLPNKAITVRQIQRIVESVSLTAIGRKVNPHMLRHTFGTRLMRTAPMRVVQELLGHKCVSSTQIYTHPNGDDLQKAINSI